MNDKQIVELYMERSEKAVNETYNKYSAYCNSISFSILQNSEDAEECVNDTFQKAWESIPPSEPNNLKAFLGKIARNISLNRLKHNNTHLSAYKPVVWEVPHFSAFLPRRRQAPGYPAALPKSGSNTAAPPTPGSAAASPR